MMSGSGTSIFAMGAPADLKPDFTTSFAKEMDVSVWATEFTSRPNDAKLWYPEPLSSS